MAISLGGVALPDLLIPDRFGNGIGISAIVDYSVAGNPIIWEQDDSSYSLDLVGGSENAWMTETQMLAIQALASVKNSTYTLTYESRTHTVRFRHEDSPILTGSLVGINPEEDANNYYDNVTIKLMVLTAPPV